MVPPDGPADLAELRYAMASARHCTICSQPALPGGRLCQPCKSALKRARDTTHSEAILPPRRSRRRAARDRASEAGRASGSPAPASAVGSAPQAAPPSSGRDRRLALAVVAFAMVALIASGAWVAHVRGAGGEVAPRYAIGDAAGATKPAAVAVTGDTPGVEPDPAMTSASPPSTPAAATVPIGETPRIAAPVAAGRSNPAASFTEVDPANRFEPTRALPMPAERVLVASPPRVELAPAEPDRWQRLADALAACPTSDLFARTVCEQSARIEHCTGAWGRSTLCPAAVERDHGN